MHAAVASSYYEIQNCCTIAVCFAMCSVVVAVEFARMTWSQQMVEEVKIYLTSVGKLQMDECVFNTAGTLLLVCYSYNNSLVN